MDQSSKKRSTISLEPLQLDVRTANYVLEKPCHKLMSKLCNSVMHSNAKTLNMRYIT